jgi:hypothetical protein
VDVDVDVVSSGVGSWELREGRRGNGKKRPLGRKLGGGQEGKYVQTLPGGRAHDHWASRGEEGQVDERTKTRRGTGPAPFSLFGHTHLVSPHYLFARLLRALSPCVLMYLPSFESSQIGQSDTLTYLIICADGRQLCGNYLI